MEEIPAFTGVFPSQHSCGACLKHTFLSTQISPFKPEAEWINPETQGLAHICVFEAKGFPPP